MSRLQALRECEYTQKTRTCTCYSVMIESQVEGVDEGKLFRNVTKINHSIAKIIIS